MSKTSQPWVATLVRTIFDQPDAAEVHAQFEPGGHRAGRPSSPPPPRTWPPPATTCSPSPPCPREIWRQIWSSNPQERLNRELRRRTDVVGIFPGRDAIIRLVGAVLMEQNDEWTEARRYMGLDDPRQDRRRASSGRDTPEEVNAIEAISA